MKKRFLTAIGTIVFTLNLAIPTYAGNGIIQNGRTLVPVRGVFERLGFKVDWDADTNKATISDDLHTVSVIRGMTYFKADGKEIYPDVPQQIIDNRFYLPLRAIGDSVGAEIEYDSTHKSAKITYNGNVAYVTTVSEMFNDTKLVYIGNEGDKYHDQDCSTITNGIIPVPLKDVEEEGRAKCGVCNADELIWD